MGVNSGCVCVSDTSVFSESIRPCALLTNIWECDNCRECENILQSRRLRIGREAQRMFHKFCLFFFLRILQEGGWEAQNKILSSSHQAPCMCWNVLGSTSEGDHLMNDGPCFPVFLSDSTCQRDWVQMEHRIGSIYASPSNAHICVCEIEDILGHRFTRVWSYGRLKIERKVKWGVSASVHSGGEEGGERRLKVSLGLQLAVLGGFRVRNLVLKEGEGWFWC